MSYSFTVQAANKLKALTQVAEELAKVVTAQPVHAADEAQVITAVSAFIEVLDDDVSRDVVVQVSGTLSSNAHGIHQASVSVGVQYAARASEAA